MLTKDMCSQISFCCRLIVTLRALECLPIMLTKDVCSQMSFICRLMVALRALEFLPIMLTKDMCSQISFLSCLVVALRALESTMLELRALHPKWRRSLFLVYCNGAVNVSI